MSTKAQTPRSLLRILLRLGLEFGNSTSPNHIGVKFEPLDRRPVVSAKETLIANLTLTTKESEFSLSGKKYVTNFLTKYLSTVRPNVFFHKL